MQHFFLTPPVAFIVFLGVSFLISALSKKLAARGENIGHKENAYACGEDMPLNHAQPDYSEFFKFAFFFTIMHVIALVVATDPGGLSIPSGVFLFVTVLSLFMLLRK